MQDRRVKISKPRRWIVLTNFPNSEEDNSFPVSLPSSCCGRFTPFGQVSRHFILYRPGRCAGTGAMDTGGRIWWETGTVTRWHCTALHDERIFGNPSRPGAGNRTECRAPVPVCQSHTLRKGMGRTRQPVNPAVRSRDLPAVERRCGHRRPQARTPVRPCRERLRIGRRLPRNARGRARSVCHSMNRPPRTPPAAKALPPGPFPQPVRLPEPGIRLGTVA